MRQQEREEFRVCLPSASCCNGPRPAGCGAIDSKQWLHSADSGLRQEEAIAAKKEREKKTVEVCDVDFGLYSAVAPNTE